MHDIILFYSKSHNNQFNVLKAEVSESQKKKYARGFDQNVIHTGIDSYKQLIVYDWEKVNKAKIDLSKFTKIIEKDKPDVNHSDVIILPVINSQAKERLGYPTQKPEILLEMLVSATTNEGDVIADFFCGCGTTIAVAERLNRQWLGVDISHLAIRLIKDRLIKPYPEEKRNEILANINIHGYPRDIASAKELSLVKNGRFMFQDWVVEILLDGVTNVKKSGDKGIDGYLTFKKSEKEKGIVIIEVKSGKFKHQDLAYLFESVKKHNADMGVFVCFDEFLTDGMKAEAKRQGNYMNYHIDKIQVLTIEELLAGKNVKLPGGAESSTFKAATKRLDTEPNNNHVLFD
jgi:site-specific DNA-methyltransferase (adenine-specific)